MTPYVEIEDKYDAPRSFRLPDLRDLPGCATVGEPETHELVADYYDTPDLRLAARGTALRRRTGGEDAGWHLKLPAAKGAKIEVRAPLGGRSVPARLAGVVVAFTRGTALRRVATLETRRTVVKLLDMSGEMLAEVADDTVRGSRADGSAEPVVWHEVEVEAGPAGSPGFLKEVGRRLRKAGAHPSDSPSKLSRVLPPLPSPPSYGVATGGEATMGYVSAQVRALVSMDPRARLAEPDAVHRMRVAVRRLRSVLRSHARMWEGSRTEPLRAELRWLAALLGEVRDLEVLRERFTTRLDAMPGQVARHRGWLSTLADREKAAYRRMNRSLSSGRYLALLDALDALVDSPPYSARAARPAETELPKIIERSWQRLVNAYQAADAAPDPLVARHEARKDAKRARYAAEAAVAALGDQAATTAAQAERLQEVMGGYQDSLVAQNYLLAAAAGASRADAFTMGVLWAVEQTEALAALQAIPAVWEAVSAARAG